MNRPNPIRLLSKSSRNLLIDNAASAKTINDSFRSALTQFNLHEESETGGTETEDMAVMRSEISKALDLLDVVVEKVLKNREGAEAAASKWITFIGFIVVLLIVAAAVSQFIVTDSRNQILASVFSSLSAAGLLYLLYSPVQKRLRIADDRSNLMLMVATFRLRFVTAQTPQQLSELGRELSEALRMARENKRIQ